MILQIGKMNNHDIKNPSGYILIDILVALTILTTGLVLFSKIIIKPYKGFMDSFHKIHAHLIIDEISDLYDYGLLSQENSKTSNPVEIYDCRTRINALSDQIDELYVEVSLSDKKEINIVSQSQTKVKLDGIK